MARFRIAVYLLCASTFPTGLACAQSNPNPNWPGFRGVNGQGVADGFKLPDDWNAEQSKNILWKTAIPGLGHACPTIWGNRIFIASAISGKADSSLKVGLYGDIAPVEDDTKHKFNLHCLDKSTGKVLWTRTAVETVPKVKRHTKATHANSTVATDGKHVVGFFGSEGLYCYDIAGKLLWKQDFGLLDSGFFMVPSAQWGFASSPLIYKDKILIQADVQKNSFLAAINLKDGKVAWKTDRGDVPTWGSPAIYQNGKKPLVVVNGWKHIGGYDFETGAEVWKLKGGGDIPVPTPVVGKDLLYITNAHGRMSPIYAIKTTASGDISLKDEETTNASIAWSMRRDGSYLPTPVLYGDYLYVGRDSGILSCYDARTGEKLYTERLGTGRTAFTASSVAGDGKVYFTSEDGDTYIVKAGPKFQQLGKSSLNEVILATPAISEGRFYFRTQGHLVAVGEKK